MKIDLSYVDISLKVGVDRAPEAHKKTTPAGPTFRANRRGQREGRSLL